MIFGKKKKNTASYTKYSSYGREGARKFSSEKPPRTGLGVAYPKFAVVFKLILWLVGIILLIGSIYYIFFSNGLVVKETGLFENDIRIDNDIILSEINVYKGSSIFGVNKNDLIAELKIKYPEIEHVKVKKKLPDKLYVYISKYAAAANLIVKVDEVERKYIINTEGNIAKADFENPALPYITMERDKAYNSRERVFTAAQLDKILKAEKLFEQKFAMEITDIIYLEKAREFHLRTEKNFELWLSLEMDYKTQLSKLKAAEQKLNIQTEPLQYIDLRIAGGSGEKVIFKRK